jgi:hypothetical protein
MFHVPSFSGGWTMNRRAGAVLVALLVIPAAARAQQPQGQDTTPAGPLAAALLITLRRAAEYMPAAAEWMPADKYGFRPTPEQMSFAEIIAHESESNETLCAALGGGTRTPTESMAGASAPKEALVERIRRSFAACQAVVTGLKESALADSVPYFGGRKATKARVAIALAQDWADHYAQAAMYLRLNGLLPPSARPRN